jgi:hypothetical protein
MKAIQLADFDSCSLETRTAVFYDLLINLLDGYPERQSTITEWSQFRDLPREDRARLYRLMASSSISAGKDGVWVSKWLQRSRDLNPKDIGGSIINLLFNLNPGFCRWFLRMRNVALPKSVNNSPLIAHN